MTDAALKWSGWEVRGSLLVTPRRVRLVPSELRLMTELMTAAIASKGRPAPLIPAGELGRRIGAGSLNGLRIWVSRLRAAIGEDAIVVVKGRGYRLMPSNPGRNDRQAIDELVEDLSAALKAARRLQKELKGD